MRHPRLRRVLAAAARGIALSAALGCVAPLVRAASEADLKAAFVYNFLLFTEWPAEGTAPAEEIVLCVSAASPLSEAMQSLRGKPVRGRRVAVRLLAAPEAARDCHVVFFDAADRARLGGMRKAIAGAPALTVTDDADLAREGMAIVLVVESNRVAFDVNLAALRQARLTVSSRLLRLARATTP